MPKGLAEQLIELANKTILTEPKEDQSEDTSEVSQFKKAFRAVANAHAINQLREGEANNTSVHEAINSVVYKKGGFLSPKKEYNLLETALLSKNEQVITYLTEQFEQSYTQEPTKDMKALYQNLPKVPPHLPMDPKKFRGADLAYATNKDTNFELKRIELNTELARKVARDVADVAPSSRPTSKKPVVSQGSIDIVSIRSASPTTTPRNSAGSSKSSSKNR